MDRAPFADRREAGRALGDRLVAEELAGADAVVLGLPRGGVPVAAEVATRLGAELDVLVVRKLGLPGRPELAMGAVAVVGDVVETVRNEPVLDRAGIDDATFERARQRELVELHRRAAAFRAGPGVPVRGRPVVVVDDGLATGATMRAAVAAARQQGSARLTVAVPVGAPDACAALSAVADRVVCLWSPASFRSVGQAYTDFTQCSDDEVRAALLR